MSRPGTRGRGGGASRIGRFGPALARYDGRTPSPGEAPSPGHWQVFLSYLLCYLLMNSLMLWSMLWLFNVRWRVRY